MKAIRIKAYQNIANYGREETSLNKSTYFLPPFSTIIGAIHNACDFEEYHEMKIGVLGNFGSLSNRIFRANLYFDSTMDDRGILVKCFDSFSLSNDYQTVAISLKKGSSFKRNSDIEIVDKNLYLEYIEIDKESEVLEKLKLQSIKKVSDELDEIKNKKSCLDNDSDLFKSLSEEEKILKNRKKEMQDYFKEKKEEINSRKSLYRTLNTSVKRIELLNQVNLILYIVPEREEDFDKIVKNRDRIISIGRTEDSVEIVSCDVIDLIEPDENLEYKNDATYNQYVDYNLVKDGTLFRSIQAKNKRDTGTVYYIPKNYQIINNIRKFDKKKVVYVSSIWLEGKAEGLFIDKQEELIVNLF